MKNIVFFFFFFATRCYMQDHSSPTWNQTHPSPQKWKCGAPTTELAEKS